MDRPGGMTAQGYGNSNYGYFKETLTGYSANSWSVTAGGITTYHYDNMAPIYETEWIWYSQEERMYGSAAGQGGGGWLETANNYSGIVTTLITGGAETTNAIVRTQFKSARSWTGWTNLSNSQQAWRTANVLGKTGAMTLKCVSTTRGVLSALSASYSTYKVGSQIYNGGLSNVNGWDLADASVGWVGTASAVVLFLGTSNPVGWAAIGIGAAGYGLFRAGQYVYENY